MGQRAGSVFDLPIKLYHGYYAETSGHYRGEDDNREEVDFVMP